MAHRWILLSSVVIWFCALSIATLLGQDRFPDGPGKPELIKVCNGCHDAQIVLANLKTPAEWTETLQNMADQGAEATQDEWRLIQQYLSANIALIAVNKATADDLQVTMDLSADLAAAIVKYRQEKGAFKSLDDVKKVPGLDPAKLEARQARFVF
jgi:competence protein ComEA